MPFLLLCAAATLFRVGAADAVPNMTSAVQAVERWEYWLYAPGANPETSQKWGVVTAPTKEMALQELRIRQDAQRKWWKWMGIESNPSKDPFSYQNVTGPVGIRPGAFRVPSGITTTNVWIQGLEETTYRRRLTREVAELRRRLEAAKAVQDELLPIGTNTSAAADLRGHTLYAAAPLAVAMAKVREVEAILQASSGNTLADLSFEVDKLRALLASVLPSPAVGAPSALPPPPQPTLVPPGQAAAPPPNVQGGTIILTPEGGSAIKPSPVAPAPQGSAITLSPAGSVEVKPSVSGMKMDGARLAITELNQRLSSPFASASATLTSYEFDREGITVRRQVSNGKTVVPQVPERIPYLTIPDPTKLFLSTAPAMVGYGNSDLKKSQYRAILALPVNTPPELGTRIVTLLRKAVSPSTEPDPTPGSNSEAGILPTGLTPAEADAKFNGSLTGIAIPANEYAPDLLPQSLPEWVKVELLGRCSVEMSSKLLAARYSGRLAEKAEVLDDQNHSASLSAIADAVTGEPSRNGKPDRVFWTVTGYEDRAGTVTMSLQASYVGFASSTSTMRAVHGAKLIETWNSAPDGATLRSVRLVRAGTVFRPIPISPGDLAINHFETGVAQLEDDRPQAAINFFESAVKISPENASYWSRYALALYRVGKNHESLSCYRLARDLDPKNALIVANYSGVLRSLGDYATATLAAKKATELDPDSAWTHEAYALALFFGKDFKNSSVQYAAAVAITPKDARLRANYASALLKAGNKRDAKVQATQAYNEGFRGHWVFAELGITN